MRVLAYLGMTMLALSAPVFAGRPADEPSRSWRTITRGDVEAARAMQLYDHPGASLELGDREFRDRLDSAYRKALDRAAKVTSFEGYTAVMAGLAAGMGDKHIWSRPLFNPDNRTWAGILIARRAGKWIVAADQEAAPARSLTGAELAGCDGLSADELGRQRIGEFRAVWSVEAQRVQRAPWMLIDDGNPFLRRPQRCTFLQAGKPREVELKWRDISRTDLAAVQARLPTTGRAGFGVRQSGAGWWIAMENLSSRALKVVEDAGDKRALLAAAPFIVLDLRGNDGGDSSYGHELARRLLGEDYVRAALAANESDARSCPKLWRASSGNLEHLDHIRNTVIAHAPREVQQQFAAEYKALQQARAKRHDFSEKPCRIAAADAPKTPLPRWPLKGKLFLLTDNSCFSSCLLVTDEFRRLGAIHVGETTDAATRYMEVREEILPSGLSAFSTLQAVATGSPPSIGPFVPKIPYDGSIADTPALESWIAALAASR